MNETFLFGCILAGATALVVLSLIVAVLWAVDAWDGLQARRRARKARRDVRGAANVSQSDWVLPLVLLGAGVAFIVFWVYQSAAH